MAKLSFLLFAAPLAATPVAPALATDMDDAKRVLVRYGDLDLADPAGRDALTARIARAAGQVCGGRSTARFNLDDHRLYVKCRSAAIRDAERQLASRLGQERLASRGSLSVAAD